MPVAPAELSGLLLAQLDARVQFLLVGGAAAVIHGAPITTQDVDIVHNREPENVSRLLDALVAMDARVHDIGGRDTKPTAAQLSGSGQSLLRTRWGRLDVFGALHDGARGALRIGLFFHVDRFEAQAEPWRGGVVDLRGVSSISRSDGLAGA